MGTIAVTLFAGITVLAVATGARAEPDGNPSVISQLAVEQLRRRVGALLRLPGGDGGHPRARGQHRVQRLPDARLTARPRRLPAPPARQPRRPAGVQQRHPAARRDRGRADPGRRRQPRGAAAPLHPGRVHELHAEPGGHGAALAAPAQESRGRMRRGGRASGARRRSTSPGPCSPASSSSSCSRRRSSKAPGSRSWPWSGRIWACGRSATTTTGTTPRPRRRAGRRVRSGRRTCTPSCWSGG